VKGVEVAFAGLAEVEPGRGDDGRLGVLVCHGCEEREWTGNSSDGESGKVVEEGDGKCDELEEWI